MTTKRIDAGTVTYNDDQATKDAVFEKVLAFFLRIECFHGESIQQLDEPQIEAPKLLISLAENTFQFEVKYDGV